MNKKARLIAFHLPQFYPTPENDKWWGKGFTEWTNVAKAKPLFPGHYQPHVPADLGFYDLRLPEARLAQAELAKEYGIEGFCYYHYWLGGGRRMLEHPVNEILASGEPDFPFCLCWANHSWNTAWQGTDKTLIEQTYPGMDDHGQHFDWLLRAFNDKRYLTIGGKPIFAVYKPDDIPEIRKVTDFWRERAVSKRLTGTLSDRGLPLESDLGPAAAWIRCLGHAGVAQAGRPHARKNAPQLSMDQAETSIAG